MKQRKIRCSLRALRRLDEIGAYIQQGDPDAAARVIARLVSPVDMLAAGRVGRIAGTGKVELPDVPYIIPYRCVRTLKS